MNQARQAHRERARRPTLSSRPVRGIFICLSLCLGCLSILSPADSNAAAGKEILLVYSGETQIYTKTRDAFESRLEEHCADRKGCPSVRATGMDQLSKALADRPQLIVSLGHMASLKALETGIPQLHILVSESQHALHQESANGPVSAIYLEQSLERQLDFIRFLIPDRPRLGVLFSEHSEKSLASLQRLAQTTGFDLHARRVESPTQAGETLRSLGPDIDVLLALPDPLVYNSNTLAGILLTAYRDRIPVMGFSAGMIRAGALGGIYSSPSTIGSEAADATMTLLGRSSVFQRYPLKLEATVNRRVADALHIELPTDSDIQRWKEDQ